MTANVAKALPPVDELDEFDDLDLSALDDLDEAELQKLLEEEDGLDAFLPPLTADVAEEAKPEPAFDVPVPPALEAIELPDAAAPVAEDLGDLNLSPVPRINIHAFCNTEGLTTLVGQAAADRRLAKAHVTIQSGDAFTAAQIFASQPTPNLIVLEADRSAQDLLEGLTALAEVCDPTTQVVVVGAVNDIKLYRTLIERGVSDYLVAPRSPLQIISMISGLYADPSAAPVGRTYAFVGARGGVGSSTVCHNVAWAIAEQCLSDTILMDMDLAFGTGSLDFEQDPSQGLAEALSAPDRLDDVLLDRLLQKCTDRLSLFGAPNLLESDYDLPIESFDRVVDIVRSAAPSVAIDLPHVWSGWTRQQLLSADEIVVTATPDLAAFRNAKNIFETVGPARSNDSKPILVLNQTGVKGRPEVSADQFADALEVEPFAVLPFEPQVFGTAATNAQTLFESAPKSKTTGVLSDLAQKLTGQAPAKGRGKGKSGSVKSLFGMLG
ncbi:AAA family ATPase [Parvularcula dongshanensis]|uniref:Pilus assembly protein CpaE n=1 Tax=Parvularcula dongshanensis TaxID=1173995 RepID=A0A840I059_9PROT|nr:pilus assembly protein CpaE [Parvularcula dongshanensis]MBB4657735.1 pilus assembly protein CpaE [Parvularcula dongshanensis]